MLSAESTLKDYLRLLIPIVEAAIRLESDGGKVALYQLEAEVKKLKGE